ncbi:hypothetical protein [Candidatus Paracaedibacter symbiosus]|uniref:hypothetical protein n=1 Tax=Candidatus Paracaedibacter symbiosus TaxID=244582 RepID=UPI000509B829|nr:hypothetical protein [Candidatus Paracaedibacter symbiosus]
MHKLILILTFTLLCKSNCFLAAAGDHITDTYSPPSIVKKQELEIGEKPVDDGLSEGRKPSLSTIISTSILDQTSEKEKKSRMMNSQKIGNLSLSI